MHNNNIYLCVLWCTVYIIILMTKQFSDVHTQPNSNNKTVVEPLERKTLRTANTSRRSKVAAKVEKKKYCQNMLLTLLYVFYVYMLVCTRTRTQTLI